MKANFILLLGLYSFNLFSMESNSGVNSPTAKSNEIITGIIYRGFIEKKNTLFVVAKFFGKNRIYCSSSAQPRRYTSNDFWEYVNEQFPVLIKTPDEDGELSLSQDNPCFIPKNLSNPNNSVIPLEFKQEEVYVDESKVEEYVNDLLGFKGQQFDDYKARQLKQVEENKFPRFPRQQVKKADA